MAVSILFGVATVLIVPFVTLYTHGITDANYNAPLLGMLIILEALTNHCKMPMDLMISSSGRFREVRAHCIAQVATTIVCSTCLGLLLLPYGAESSLCGIVAGVCVGNLVRAVCQLRFVPREVTGLSWRKSALRIAIMFANVAVIAVPCLMLISPPQRFFTWAMYGVMLVFYATAVTFASAWLFDRRALKSLFSRLNYMLRRL